MNQGQFFNDLISKAAKHGISVDLIYKKRIKARRVISMRKRLLLAQEETKKIGWPFYLTKRATWING